MYVKEMTDAIKARLEEVFAAQVVDLAVEDFPDDPDDYQLYHPCGALLVGYGGSKFGQPEALGALVQRRTVVFDLTLLVRNLRGPEGAQARLDAVRLALTGYPLAGGVGSKIRPLSEELGGHKDGVWTFALQYAADVPAVEEPPEESFPVLQRITLEDETTTTEITADGS